MNYWLLKSEPYNYSYDDLVRDKRGCWDGVRNYQARNNLRAMKKGDRGFFYHSNEGKEIVGIIEVIKEYYPDPTATKGDWSVVDIKPIKRFKTPVSLTDIKSVSKLNEMALVKQMRLSVSPVRKKEFELICQMGGV